MQVEEILLSCMNESDEDTSENQQIKSKRLSDLLKEFRETISTCSDQNIWDLERLLDEGVLDFVRKNLNEEKRKPGRLPKQKPNPENNWKINQIITKVKTN